MKKILCLLLAAALPAAPALAQKFEGLALTPPMGFNTWNTFAKNINEALIMETADIMVKNGMRDAGYTYIVLDDCWSLRDRDADGSLVPDPAKFPSGMKALGDYLHAHGFKFGIYSCAGSKTCGGYPGSMGADFVPWVVADELLIPPEHEDQYRETVLRLPHGWGAVRPAVPETTRSRSDYGLPVDAMVYCCLNATYKIEPVVFALWMEILRQVPGSVLWLTDGGRSGSNERLRQQARAAGIAPERLVFAGRVPHAEYLARYRLADLFLDTFSYNAGSTALATFAAGLPMLTCPGEHYPRRMGASLCQAAGMPELICTSHDEYLHRAIELGQHPERLAALKRTLAERIESAPLFQPERFIAGLEALYRQLWQQWCEANPATAESLV